MKYLALGWQTILSLTAKVWSNPFNPFYKVSIIILLDLIGLYIYVLSALIVS